jgi:hypothetical protein
MIVHLVKRRPPFMEPEASLMSLQQPDIGSYIKKKLISKTLPCTSFKIHFNIIFLSML